MENVDKGRIMIYVQNLDNLCELSKGKKFPWYNEMRRLCNLGKYLLSDFSTFGRFDINEFFYIYENLKAALRTINTERGLVAYFMLRDELDNYEQYLGRRYGYERDETLLKGLFKEPFIKKTSTPIHGDYKSSATFPKSLGSNGAEKDKTKTSTKHDDSIEIFKGQLKPRRSPSEILTVSELMALENAKNEEVKEEIKVEEPASEIEVFVPDGIIKENEIPKVKRSPEEILTVSELKALEDTQNVNVIEEENKLLQEMAEDVDENVIEEAKVDPEEKARQEFFEQYDQEVVDKAMETAEEKLQGELLEELKEKDRKEFVEQFDQKEFDKIMGAVEEKLQNELIKELEEKYSKEEDAKVEEKKEDTRAKKAKNKNKRAKANQELPKIKEVDYHDPEGQKQIEEAYQNLENMALDTIEERLDKTYATLTRISNSLKDLQYKNRDQYERFIQLYADIYTDLIDFKNNLDVDDNTVTIEEKKTILKVFDSADVALEQCYKYIDKLREGEVDELAVIALKKAYLIINKDIFDYVVTSAKLLAAV